MGGGEGAIREVGREERGGVGGGSRGLVKVGTV